MPLSALPRPRSSATPEVHTARFTYFRFRQPIYTADEVGKLADRIERCVEQGLETFAFFKHEEDPRSPLKAVELLKLVRRRIAQERL